MDATVKVTINGSQVSVPAGATMLEDARGNGVEMPTLCHVKGLPPLGSCRMCVGEVAGSRTLVGACHTPVTEGNVIQTHFPRAAGAGSRSSKEGGLLDLPVAWRENRPAGSAFVSR